MAIVGDLSTRIRSFLDDDSASSERYGLLTDILPAMNAAISYLVAVFSAAFDSKQIKPEVLTNLVKAKVLDSTATGVVSKVDLSSLTSTGKLWRILGIEPNPTVSVNTYDDWFLPSKDELNEMHNLHLAGTGNFSNSIYWSSSEYSTSNAWAQDFSDGSQIEYIKSNLALVRPIRKFTSTIGAYLVGDTGPAGGWIFYIDGITYYEAASEDLVGAREWSNVVEVVGMVESFSPSLIRNVEGDNVSPSSTTTLLEITAVNGNEITLGTLDAFNLADLKSLITDGVDWFAMSLDDFNSSEPGYVGDYTVQDKVASFDLDNGKINLVDATGFTVGDNICLYSPFVNYEFLPGQESEGIINSVGAASWRDYYNSAGPSWYDEVNGVYVVLVNGRTAANDPQVGFAYSTDLVTWTMGNGDLPIIEHSDHANFATFAIATGNAIELSNGKVAFSVWGRDALGDNKINIVQMNKDCTDIVISNGVLDSVDAYGAGLSYFNGKYVLLVTNSAPANLYDWTVEMWESSTIDSGYTKTTDVFTSQYNNNDSVWLEGHADSLTPFVENGKLYAMVSGTQRYVVSGILGNRVYGIMEYDGTNWIITHDFAPEFIFPMYFADIPGEDYAWAAGHAGGYFSFIKKDGNIYAFCSFLLAANSYQVAAIKIVDNVNEVSTSTAIGTGEANTTSIVNQDGHTTSAAQDSLDLTVNSDAVVSLSLGNMAGRLTLEEWNHAQENPFMRGSTASMPSIFNELAYTGPGRFFGDNKDYILLRPASLITDNRVVLYYLESPTTLSSSGDTIQFPSTLHNLIVQKTIQYLSYQHSKDAKYFQITDKDIKEVIGLMNI